MVTQQCTNLWETRTRQASLTTEVFSGVKHTLVIMEALKVVRKKKINPCIKVCFPEMRDVVQTDLIMTISLHTETQDQMG